MVYLTARSTTNLYDSTSSLHNNHHHPLNGTNGHHSLMPLTNGGGTLPSKIYPSIRFNKFQKQRQLHQSNWTLDYQSQQPLQPQLHQNYFNDDQSIIYDDYFDPHHQIDDDTNGSLLLLSPYSKSCYLMAQQKQQLNRSNNNSNNFNNYNSLNRKLLKRRSREEEEDRRIEEVNKSASSSKIKSKSMLNLRNSNHTHLQHQQQPQKFQQLKKRQSSSSSNNNHHNNGNNNNDPTIKTSTSTTIASMNSNKKKNNTTNNTTTTTILSSTCSSSSTSSAATTTTNTTQSPIDDVDDDDDGIIIVDDDLLMVAVDDNNDDHRHHQTRKRSPRKPSSSMSSSKVSKIMIQQQQQQRTKEQILRAKHRASILWLIAKAQDNGRIPQDLRDPFYRDLQGQDLLKPWITQRLANAELYGMALSNIYGVPDYSSLSHQNIIQLLTRRGVYQDQLGLQELGEYITETMLLKNCPIKLQAHMIIIECLMNLYIREILIPVKVYEVTTRFSGDDVYTELPPSPDHEDVALYWVNRACQQLNQEIKLIQSTTPNDDDLNVVDEYNQSTIVVPTLEELSDMCDGCSLYALLAFYCPEHVNWREICLKPDIAIADSIYNLQRVQYYCQELFPSDICFLSLEDFLYLPEPIVPNFLAFIADLLFMFEIQPVDAVTPPYLRLYPELYQDEYQPNYPQMLTPSEMRAKSLKSSWNNNDSIETSSGGSEYPPNHPMYDRPSFTNNQRTSSNLTLNYYNQQQQQPTPPSQQPQHAAGISSQQSNNTTSSRRNSLQKSLHRRSSLLSNGSELIPNHLQQPDDDNVYTEPINSSSQNQLSTYFSSMSINNNGSHHHPHHNNHHSHHLHHHQPSIGGGDNEYEKNRSRASGGHLTDYFSSLSNVNDPTIISTSMSNNNNQYSSNTHVRAQRSHPNNTDNVKQLLSHHQQPHQQQDHFNQQDSQTNSSDTSSLAEISEYSDQIKQQLNEKRKQIEADRQQERQKRASSDLDFRQEVLKTLKNINNNNNNNSQIDETDFVSSQKNPEDENLTFEIHELNPIRREKTFTSIPSSLVGASASSSTSTPSNTNTNKTSTFVRKNLFSASEDLKASMSDLNYANAKEYHQTPTPPSKQNSLETSIKTTSTPEVEPTIKTTTTTAASIPLSPSSSTDNQKSIPEPIEQIAPPSSSSSQQLVQQPHSTPMVQSSAPRHRSQWGQPMIPLAGQVQQPLPTTTSQHPPYPQPPAWSQTPETTPSQQAWYPNNQSPYHHPMVIPPVPPPPQPAYPYHGYGVPPPPPTMHHPYDPYGGAHHHHPYVPPPVPPMPHPTQQQQPQQQHQQDPYLSPMNQYPHQIVGGPGASSSYPSQQQQQPNATLPFTTANDHQEDHQIDEQQQQQSNQSTMPSPKQISSHQNETFFISFDNNENDSNRTKRSVGGSGSGSGSGNRKSNDNKQTLIRTATQTLVNNNSEDNSDDSRIKELYNVRRPSNPPVPSVSFVIGVDSSSTDLGDISLISENSPKMNGIMMMTNGNNDDNDEDDYEDDNNGDGGDRPQRPRTLSLNNSKSEEEMARKKEAIMKQSLRRRALQESKRIQKEQELALKREQERLKREQMERKKEEEREKRAFILDQYKRKKQLAEEIEKNGGVAALQGTVARSSSTLILNRNATGGGQTPGGQPGVSMRVRGSINQQRPRPKSLHAALLDECQSALSTFSGSSGRLSSSRDEIDDLTSHCGRISSTASTSASSRPQSAMSSQLCSSTAVSTPTGGNGGPFGDSGPFGTTDLTSGPTSNTFYQEYNGPKLFVKPSQKSNKALILNAINVVLAGTVNADTNRRVTEVINKCDSKYYLILFRNSGLQYRAIYSYNPEREEVLKLDGIGPKLVHNDMIDKFYKYNSGTKSFTAIQTKHLCVTIDAFTIHNHLWISKAKQQQQQSTPRRFLP